MTRDYDAISRYNEEQLGKDRKSRMSQVAMYADTAHFVYELLQNADDAGATGIDFLLRPTELIVEHDGKPFDEQDVRAISYFGKGKTAVTAIGRFGLGFKSVFAYTSAPRIHSAEDDFELVDLYTLRPLSRPRDLAPGRTRFVLPFDHTQKRPDYVEAGMLKSPEAAFAEIAGKLRDMGGATLLFTDSLREIGWLAGAGTGWYRRTDRALDGGGRETTLRAHDTGEQHYLVFERGISWPDDSGRPAQRRPAALAFEMDGPLADGGAVTGAPNQKLWVFFPTDKETHTGIIVQGPFRTTPSRDNVPVDDGFNRHLIHEIAVLLRQSLWTLRQTGLVDVELLTLLPIDVDFFPPEDFFRPLYESVRSALLEQQFLPTGTGTHLRAGQARLARGQKLTEVFDGRQLSDLFGCEGLDWLDPSITADRYPLLHRFLTGVKRRAWSDEWDVEPLVEGIEVSIEDIAEQLTAEFAEKQSDEWLIRFYLYLHDSRGGVSRHFTSRPILRLDDGSHVAPWTDQGRTPGAYLPTDADTDLPTVKRAIASHPTVLKFLLDLGLTTPDVTDEVLTSVVPKYLTEGRHGIEEWRKDFKRILGALASPDPAKRQRLITKLQEASWLLCKRNGEEGLYLAKPGVAYAATDELKAYFRGNAGTYLLADGHYTTEQISRLVAMVGVAGAPRATLRKPDWQGHVTLSSWHGFHRRGLDGFDPDWAVDGLEGALGLRDVEVARYVWNRIGVPNAGLVQGVVERSSRKTYADAKRERRLSSAGKLLRESGWLPDRDGTFHRPGELYLTDLPDGFERESLEARRLSEALGMKQPESQQAIATLARGNPRLKDLMERLALEEFDDEVIAKIEKVLPKVEKPPPAGSFKDALTRLHRSPTATPVDEPAEPGGAPVRNPERYTDKLKERADEARRADRKPRVTRFSLVRERQDTKEARAFLYQEYQGRCQVTGETFRKANGENYFEAVTLVPTQGTEFLNNAGNMLCLSADTAARFMHASFEWIDDLGWKIEAFRTEREGGTVEDRQLRVKLGDEDAVITFSERHFLRLRALWRSEEAAAPE